VFLILLMHGANMKTSEAVQFLNIFGRTVSIDERDVL
jgi:hypothetical protein